MVPSKLSLRHIQGRDVECFVEMSECSLVYHQPWERDYGHDNGRVDCDIVGWRSIGYGITYPRSMSCGSAGRGIVDHSRRTNHSSVGRSIIKKGSAGDGIVDDSRINHGSYRIVNRGSFKHGIVGRGSLRHGKASRRIVEGVVNRSIIGLGSIYSGLIDHGIIAEVC